MTITEIKQEKKHLMRLVLNDGNDLLLDKDICFDNSLAVGQEITANQLSLLCHSSEYKRAKSRAFWYLDRADHTEKALYNKLVRAGFNKKVCAEVIARLVELGVVNDLNFAQRFAERCMENNISKREALHKLLEKGVPLDTAKQVLENIEANEEEQLAQLIEKKYAYKLTQQNGTQKVFAALARKGFSFSAIKLALKRYEEDIEFSEEY